MELLNDLKDRSLFRYGAIALALLGLALVLMSTERAPRDNQDQALRGEGKPDGFIEGGTYRTFDEEGLLSSRIHSQRADQYTDAGFILMQSPTGVLFEQSTRLPWEITAKTGRYLLDNENLELSGNVTVERQAGEGRTSRMETERLTLDNRQRLVHTDAPVTLHDSFGQTDAIGLRGQIDERVVEFDQRVRGSYRLK
ncbi:MAG: LPS export ABC transporter periplasmic protein LptC [Halomonadaceae bacterium]|nr:MAG: LPS export ABC transporter periplasmic protein LptC [Halomonadaceae bacterium]